MSKVFEFFGQLFQISADNYRVGGKPVKSEKLEVKSVFNFKLSTCNCISGEIHVTKPVKRAGNKPRKPLDNWIRPELKRLYGKAYSKKGVDLNGDGKLQAHEKIASFDNNNIPGYRRNETNPYKGVVGDWTDWLTFYRANHKLITAKAGNNQSSIFHWAAKLKATNPLHIVTTVESALVSRKKVLGAYRRVWKIASLSRRLKNAYLASKGKEPKSARLGPTNSYLVVEGKSKKTLVAKVANVYVAMNRSGIKFKNQDSELFLETINGPQLDCDGSSFVVMAEGHEQGWPIYLVSAPSHMFVRWDNGLKDTQQMRFNMDFGLSRPDSSYRKRISSHAISQQVYLENLSQRKFVATVLHNRAGALRKAGRYRTAIREYTRALSLNPKARATYNNRGRAYNKLKRYDKELRDYNQSIRLAPKQPESYYCRSNVFFTFGEDRRALRDLNMALSLNPKKSLRALAYNNRAAVYARLGQYEKARRDARRALQLNPKLRTAKKLLTLLRLKPRLSVNAHIRVRPSGNKNYVDGRLATSLQLGLWSFGRFSVVSGLELGYGVGKDHHVLDVLGLVALEGRVGRSTIGLEMAVGYNFILSGVDDNAPIGKGGTFRYGLKYTHHFRQYGLSVFVHAQHQFSDPAHPAILGGIGFTWDFTKELIK